MFCFLQEEHEDGLGLFSPFLGSSLATQWQVHPNRRAKRRRKAKSLTAKDTAQRKTVWIRFTAADLPFQLFACLIPETLFRVFPFGNKEQENLPILK